PRRRAGAAGTRAGGPPPSPRRPSCPAFPAGAVSRAATSSPTRSKQPRRERTARGRTGPGPLAPAPRRVLLAPARRPRRRGAEGRGHRDGRLRALGAAVLRGRRRLGEVGALPG